jgi:tight adherence protein B
VTLLPAVLIGLAVLVLVALPGEAAGRLAGALPRGRTDAAPPARLRPPVSARSWAVRLPARPWRRLVPVASGIAGLLVAGPAVALVAAVVTVAALAAARARAAAATARAERGGAVEACAVLAAELRAGRAPGSALDAAAAVAAGPLQARLTAASAALRFGGDPASALRTATPGPATCVPEVVAALGACWEVCAGTGSGLASAVERLEEGLRGAAAARRSVEAELAGPRATAGLLALLPLAGVGLAAALGARPLHVLLGTPVGGVCLVLGVGLDLTGLAWTRRIARGAGAT